MENLKYMRELEYLNLALNNISKIEGIQNCEFLKKLDLTLNFVDFDMLEVSMKNLQKNENLKDLFMMGNPSQANWDNKRFESYVIAMLPQLEHLDGVEITKSMRIQARQKLASLQVELKDLADNIREEKKAKGIIISESSQVADEKDSDDVNNNDAIIVEDASDNDSDDPEARGQEITENTPEAREEIYRELAQQKKEKEDREQANRPKNRDYEKEHAAKKEEIRRKEEEAGEREVRQKNEGGWTFRWDEESRSGLVVLEVSLSRHLDSSLIDCDVHPQYVSIVIKSKVLRLKLPAEVKAAESRCERSKVTGSLMVIMPKLNSKENAVTVRGDKKERERKAADLERKRQELLSKKATIGGKIGSGSASGGGRTKFKGKKPLSIQEQMLAAAMSGGDTVFNGIEKLDLNSSGSGVDIKNIVKKPKAKNTDDEDSSVNVNIEIGNDTNNSNKIQIVESTTTTTTTKVVPPVVPDEPEVIEMNDDGSFIVS